MPRYLDIQELDGPVSHEDVAKAHAANAERPATDGAQFRRFWIDEARGRIYCMVEAPDAESAKTAHREVHGLVAHEMYEVGPQL